MNIFSIELTLPEIQTLRQSLDVITIAGKDAQFLAALQIKLESEIQQIATMQSAPQPKKSR
jgi:hypothetical protein